VESSEFLEPAVVSLVNRPSTTSNFPESVVVSSISRLSNTSDFLESAVVSSNQPSLVPVYPRFGRGQHSQPSFEYQVRTLICYRAYRNHVGLG